MRDKCLQHYFRSFCGRFPSSLLETCPIYQYVRQCPNATKLYEKILSPKEKQMCLLIKTCCCMLLLFKLLLSTQMILWICVNMCTSGIQVQKAALTTLIDNFRIISCVLDAPNVPPPSLCATE